MRVLHVYRTCLPVTAGGVEQVIRYISKGCGKLGVESKVIALADRDEVLQFEGVEITLCKRNFSIGSNCFSFSFFRSSTELIRWSDIVHFHYPWPTGDLLALTIRKPIVITYHSDIVRQSLLKKFYFPLERYFLSKATAIVATSQNYADSSTELIRYKGKCSVIPLAIDQADYSNIDPSCLVQTQRRFGEGFFLFIGVLRYYKGLNFLIDAAAQNGLQVVIAGDGPEKRSIEKKIERLGLKNVRLAGYITEQEKLSLLKLCKVFVLPSHIRSEAFGVSLIEALCLGKPCISCEINTGTSFVNLHNETGIVIEPSNTKALSEAMLYLDSEDDIRRKMSSNAYLRFVSLFSAEKMAEDYRNLYSQTIAEHLSLSRLVKKTAP